MWRIKKTYDVLYFFQNFGTQCQCDQSCGINCMNAIMLVECTNKSDNCSCPTSCGNRRIQNKQWKLTRVAQVHPSFFLITRMKKYKLNEF